MILNEFLFKYMYVPLNGLNLSGTLEEFSITSRICVQVFKNQLFEENKRFECRFIELKYR